MTDNEMEAKIRLEESQERVRYLEALSRMQTAIANEESLGETLSVVIGSVVSLLGADAAMVLLISEDKRTLTPMAAVGVQSDGMPGLTFDPERGLPDGILEMRKPVRIEDTSRLPEIHLPILTGGNRARALAAMPICLRNEPLGALLACSAEPRAFSDADMASLSVFADSVSAAIVHARTYAEVVRERIKLETALETIPSGALIIDLPDGRISLANRRLGEFFGYGVEIGTPLSELAHGITFRYPDGSNIPLNDLPIMRALLHGDRIDGEETGIIRPDGISVTALANAAPLVDESGKIYGAVGEFEDVTAMKEAQQALQTAFEKVRRISATLQTALLPDIPDRIGSLALSGAYRPGYVEDYVGGDFYDVFSPKPGYVALVIGDVSGKGINGAVRTALTKYTLRAYAYEDLRPASVVRRLNTTVCTQMGTEYFVTLFYGLLNLEDKTLTFVNAGHERPLHLTCSECRLLELTDGGTPLGVIDGRAYSESTVQLKSNDRVLLYTDGVTEARGSADFLGADAPKAFFLDHRDESPREFTAHLLDRVLDFSEGRLRDDVAILLACID